MFHCALSRTTLSHTLTGDTDLCGAARGVVHDMAQELGKLGAAGPAINPNLGKEKPKVAQGTEDV